MKYSKLFITGVDSKTKWMLPWFQENFYTHNPGNELLVFDFDKSFTQYDGWFKKPYAMMNAGQKADFVCWVDVDIEINDNYDGIWDHVQENKLLMAEDTPWTRRRGTKWHNSGVVAFTTIPMMPNILFDWCRALDTKHGQVGDQEVLHTLLSDDLKRMVNITDMPRRYNTLRLDLHDGTAPEEVAGMHWTGKKGKEHIKGLMNNE